MHGTMKVKRDTGSLTKCGDVDLKVIFTLLNNVCQNLNKMVAEQCSLLWTMGNRVS
jgi:hypothetical protein